VLGGADHAVLACRPGEAAAVVRRFMGVEDPRPGRLQT